MYDRDMPKIRDYGLSTPEGFADVATFVLLTIQQRLETIEAAFHSTKKRGADSPWLFGSKFDGYQYIQKHKHGLWMNTLYDIDAGVANDDVANDDAFMAIWHYSEIPGLGIVKSAFLAQCLGWKNACCLDALNLKRLGIDHFRTRKDCWTATRKGDKIREYIDLCSTYGNARWFWDTWCEHKAATSGWYTSADQVSAAHPRALGLS